MKKSKFIFITLLSSFAIALSLAWVKNGTLDKNNSANDRYSLTLDTSNALTTSKTGTQTKSIAVATKGWNVDFSYTNVSNLGGYHCRINDGGTLKNVDHIRSIEHLVVNYVAQANAILSFRVSYDNLTWGTYNPIQNNYKYTLSSHPYFIEFKAEGGYVNLSSIDYEYTCEVNPNAETGLPSKTTYNLVTSSNFVSGATYVVGDFVPGSSAEPDYGYVYNVYSNWAEVSLTQAPIEFVASGTASSFTLKSGSSYLYSSGAKKISLSSSSTNWSINTSGVISSGSNILSYNSTGGLRPYNGGYGSIRGGLFKVTKGVEVGVPDDVVGFTVIDSHTGYYNKNDIFDAANGLVVKTVNTNGEASIISKGGDNGYSYVVKDSNGVSINASLAFGNNGGYTVIVNYKDYIPAIINITVGEVVPVSIEAVIMEEHYLIEDIFDITDNILVDITYNDGTVAELIEYSDFSIYGLDYALLNPSGVNHTIGTPFGIVGAWKLKVYLLDNPAVFDECDITVTETPLLEKTTIGRTYKDYNDYCAYETDNCPSTGNPKLLIIPVWFTDSSNYIAIANKENVRSDIATTYLGTNEETGWRSVKTFYEEESGDKVSLQGTVTSWYECGNSTSYYNSSNSTASLAKIASDWYFTNNPTDSRQNYDTDSNGYLDGVMLIYGAPDYQAYSSMNDNMWAYCFWIQESSYRNVTSPNPNVYFWASYDFMYNSSKASDRTGKSSYGHGDTSHCNLDAHTFIHEMGHVFGLDDYYDYSDQCTPAGSFSMQDYNVGSHDPYSIMALGWANPYIPTESMTIEIGTFQETRDLILLTPSWNTVNSAFDEYLLLELYSPTGLNKFDSDYKYNNRYPQGPTSIGLRVWHVDARLVTNDGEYWTDIVKDPTTCPYGVTHAMSNTYYSSEVEGYYSVLGSSYADYNILQLIRNSTSETYKPTSHLSADSLFGNGSSFTMSKYGNQFKNTAKLNSNINLGWSFTVSITSNRATINLTKI